MLKPALVQVSPPGSWVSGSTNVYVTLQKTPALGNMLVLVTSTLSTSAYSTITAVSSTGVTWVKAKAVNFLNSGIYTDLEVWYALAVPANAGTIIQATISSTAALNEPYFYAIEVSGCAYVSAVDQTASNYYGSGQSNSSSTVIVDSGTTATTTNPNEFCLAVLFQSALALNNPTNGFTPIIQTYGLGLYYYLATSEMKVNLEATLGNGTIGYTNWSGIVVTFIAASGALPVDLLTIAETPFIIYQSSSPSTPKTATITATLVNAVGAPYTGKTLTFATSLGTLSASSGTTNSSGQVAVTLTSSSFGLAVVSCAWAGDANVPAATVYINVHVFYGAESGNSALPFQVFVEGYPLNPPGGVGGNYTVNYRMLGTQFQVLIPKWDPNIVANGLVGIWRSGTKEYGGVLQRIERVLGEEPTVTLSGVDFGGLMNTRVIDSENLTGMTPEAAISYLLGRYGCGITAGALGTYSGTPNVYGTVATDTIVRRQGNARGVWSSGTTFTATESENPVFGNTLVAIVGVGDTKGASVYSIAQTGVNWSRALANALTVSGTTYDVEIWLGQVVGPSYSTTVTVTLTTAPTGTSGYGAAIDVCEYPGTLVTLVDQTVTNQAGSVASPAICYTGPTPLTSQANELCVAAFFGTTTAAFASPTEGFSLLDGAVFGSGSKLALAYLENIISTQMSPNVAVTSSAATSYAACMVTLMAEETGSLDAPSADTVQLQPLIKSICDQIGWTYRVNTNLTLDFAPSPGNAGSFGRGLEPVSFVEGSTILTCQMIVDYSTDVNVLHCKGNGINATAVNTASVDAIGLMEGTDLYPAIEDQGTLNTQAQSALNNLQNAAVTTYVLEGVDTSSPGTFLPEDEVTVTSVTLGLSGGYVVASVTRDLAKPAAYCSLQLTGLLREFLLLDEKYRRILHDATISVS